MPKGEDFDVKPSKKKKDSKKTKDKAKQFLMSHPEILYNARDYFRNKNWIQVVEDIVPRGDLKKEEEIYPRNQGDLKEDDLRGLAVYASMLLNKDLMDLDPKTAMEDALTMAIGWKDEGKYAGKVNANTFKTILNHMGKIKKASIKG